MKRTRQKRRGSLGREIESLIRLASGLAGSGGLAEDRYWESRLAQEIDTLLEEDNEDTLTTALDTAYTRDVQAYEALADHIESRAETRSGLIPGHEVLLIGAPVLAWSRFRIPAHAISPAVLANLRVHLLAHVFASQARIALADFLFSPDQLPRGYCATAAFATELGKAAAQDTDLHIDPRSLEDTTHFLSDTRYLLIAVVVPEGQPFFSWQEDTGSREHAYERWRSQGGACLQPLLPGCTTEVVLPETYFAASRQADRQSRPYAIRASVAFLGAELETPAANLRAVIAPFHDQELEEYRIGFTLPDTEQIVHGVVWPLLGAEDDETDIPAQIETVLRDCGINDIVTLDHRFPLEYCDDCGAPMYPSADGEAVHPEMPGEHDTHTPRHLH